MIVCALVVSPFCLINYISRKKCVQLFLSNCLSITKQEASSRDSLPYSFSAVGVVSAVKSK